MTAGKAGNMLNFGGKKQAQYAYKIKKDVVWEIYAALLQSLQITIPYRLNRIGALTAIACHYSLLCQPPPDI